MTLLRHGELIKLVRVEGDYPYYVRGVECENYVPMYRAVATDSTRHNAELSGALGRPLDWLVRPNLQRGRP